MNEQVEAQGQTIASKLNGLRAVVLGAKAAVVLALALTGWNSARLKGAPRLPSIARDVLGGLLARAVTFGVGKIARKAA